MKKYIVILHGWAKDMTGNRYEKLGKILEESGFVVFSPDLPGFGIEPLVKTSMHIDDYVTFVKGFLQKKGIEKVIIIGHSFGGRIAAKLAVQYPELVEKLILSGSPLVKQPLSFKKKALQCIARFGKLTRAVFPQTIQDTLKKGLYRAIGEWDYYKAGELKETLKNIIAEDLSPILPKINIPTLAIWGEDDTFVPVATAKEIVKKIPHAQLIVLHQAGHKIPYDNPKVFAESLTPFII